MFGFIRGASNHTFRLCYFFIYNLTIQSGTNLQLLVFEDLEVPTHKTKNIVNYVKQMENTKKVLVVDGGPISDKLKLATQNLHYVNVLPSIVSRILSTNS